MGFDLTRFRENTKEKRDKFRKEWGIKEDEIAIGIVGRLVPIKDHNFFLDAASKINHTTSKKIKFLIVGDGELRPILEQKVLNENINNVVFTI